MRDKYLAVMLLGMVVLLLGGVIPVFLLGLYDWAVSIVLGFFTSLIYIFFAYITIRQAFVKSTTIFYRYFFGGMAFRFIFFLLSLIIVYKLTQLPILVFIVSFIIFYVIFQFIEARLVLQEIKTQKNH